MQSKMLPLAVSCLLGVVAVAGRSAGAAPRAPRAETRARPTPSVAPAPSVSPVASIQVQNCLAVPADRTTKLTGNGIEAFSPTTFGHGAECPAFVADFLVDSSAGKVEPSSNLSPNLVFDGRDVVRETAIHPYSASTYRYYMKVTEAQCTSHQHRVQVYRKKAGETSFTSLGGGSLTPTWNAQGIGFGPVCLLAPGPGFKAIPQVVPPTTGTDVVRVVVDVPGAPGQMSASAMHPKRT